MTLAQAPAPAGGSLRRHPVLADLFRAAEARHLTAEELETYARALPEHAARAAAAAEVARHEGDVVGATVTDIFALFPFEETYEFGHAKCTRDVRYVSAYATLAMLMRDGAWYDEKLLQWMRTIVQAFRFPERRRSRPVLFARRDSDEKPRTPGLDAIRTTYTRLRDGYEKALSADAFVLMRPYLQQTIDVLGREG
ncbi:MAG: hypothetical protein KC620_23660 [Myxococcales bacterium]|nr:hypothetical protein [Myxococcales bacterium]